MRPFRPLLFTMLMFLSLFAVSSPATAETKVRVTNGEQFLRALKSNTHIVIAKGSKIMLTEALDNESLREELSIGEINTYEPDYSLYNHVETLGYYDNFDGNQLVVAGLSNLTIEGEGGALNGPSIIASPRYAYVLFFVCCRNLSLVNVTLGHTEEGYCEGGVVMLDHCTDVDISGCDMYGCGTEGIGASQSENISCSNSYIRDCSYQIMTLNDCTNVAFNGCEFFRNKEFSLVNVGNCTGVSFVKCKFYDNRGPLFSLSNAQPVLDECMIRHSREMLGSIGEVQWNATQFFGSDGVQYEAEEVYPDEEKVSYYDNDWKDHVLKVNDQTPRPGIADFFIALAHKSNSPLIKAASLALNPPYKSAVDIVEVDKKNGYIFVANLPENANVNDYRAVEACFWRCNDGTCLFAVNHLLQEDATILNFYRYDPRRRLLSPVDDINELTTPVNEPVYVSLPRVGKTIQYLMGSNPEKQYGTETFDGKRFLFRKTGGRSVSVDNATNSYGIGNMVSFMRRYN